jgi:hypothetical protein
MTTRQVLPSDDSRQNCPREPAFVCACGLAPPRLGPGCGSRPRLRPPPSSAAGKVRMNGRSEGNAGAQGDGAPPGDLRLLDAYVREPSSGVGRSWSNPGRRGLANTLQTRRLGVAVEDIHSRPVRGLLQAWEARIRTRGPGRSANCRQTHASAGAHEAGEQRRHRDSQVSPSALNAACRRSP